MHVGELASLSVRLHSRRSSAAIRVDSPFQLSQHETTPRHTTKRTLRLESIQKGHVNPTVVLE